jgi:flavin-binding protein dodecin
MAILKVIEVLGNSDKSWDDAAQKMINEAAKTVKNIKSIYVVDMSAHVENNKITEYRINGKITFEVGE